MSLRTRLFIVISLAVLVILGISIALLVRSKRAAAPPALGITNTPTAPANIIDSNTVEERLPALTNPPSLGVVTAPPAKQTTLEAEQSGVRQLAVIFVERYNSYSTDNKWQNIVEVKSLVTQKMWQRIGAKVGTPQPAGPFVGNTAEVFVSELTKWDPPTAVATLQVRNTLEKNGQITVTNQNIVVTLIKDSGDWLVDSYEVQK
ncbi:MAG: hypothetical protein Q7K39_04350 [Candidatus Magasanikbacteria bacterium]|nr:hypothetical protein [Candidatus Magasanikbacteria bacterium]